MPRSFLARFAVPGGLPENGVRVACIALTLGICWLDIAGGADIRLRVLYVFPLAGMAFHSPRNRDVVLAFILAVLCDVASLQRFSLSAKAVIIDEVGGAVALLMVAILARMAREQHLEARLRATQDPLTQLHNRRSFESIAEMELVRQRRYGGVFSLVALDLDGFKELNDSRGHQDGDLALKAFAEILRENTRESDTVARLGGDEFVILMPMTGKSDLTVVCEQLRETIASQMADLGFAITSSIGHATFEKPPVSLVEALREADRAMYAAKSKGKGYVASF